MKIETTSIGVKYTCWPAGHGLGMTHAFIRSSGTRPEDVWDGVGTSSDTTLSLGVSW